jgi:hypothetical protein
MTATVAGNVRVTAVGHEYDTHHIVLDFGAMPFPVLEGQSIAGWCGVWHLEAIHCSSARTSHRHESQTTRPLR